MPKVSANLIEDERDFRSSEIGLRFEFSNAGSMPVDLLSVAPRVPEGVKLLESKEFSLLETKSRHTRLCRELNDLLTFSLSPHKEEILKKRPNKQRAETPAILRILLPFTDDELERRVAEKRADDLLEVRIEDVKDARNAFDRFVNAESTDRVLKDIFETKMQKLEECENKLGGANVDIQTSAISTIEAGSQFSVRYILQFPRNKFDSAQFNVTVDATFREADQRQTCSAACSINIAPHPMILSIVAIIAALLGVVLKHAVTNMAATDVTELNWSRNSAESLAAAILGFMVFNIYEFTDMFKNLRSRISWRHSLFIGLLCGVAAERLFDAVKAFAGS